MQRLMITAAIAALITAAPAVAQPVVDNSGLGNTINGGVRYDDNSTTTNNTATGGAGGAGGVGVGVGLGGAGGSANVGPITTTDTNIVAPVTTVSPTIRTDVTTTDINLNDLTNTQGQQQGQLQGQVATGGNASQGQSLTDNSVHTASASTGASTSSSNSGSNSFRGGDFTFNEAKQRLQAPAMGSTVVINTAECTRGGSISFSVPGGGAQLGHSRGNERCEDREDAKVLLALGEKEAAVLVMSGYSAAEAVRIARDPARATPIQ